MNEAGPDDTPPKDRSSTWAVGSAKDSTVQWTRRFDSPLGPLDATVDTNGLLRGLEFARSALEFVDSKPTVETSAPTEAASEALSKVVKQLDEYFASARRSFDLPLRPTGTAFQEQIWESLLTIPFGATESYGGLAHRMDNPKAVRAVGRANGANPIAIVIPCHRVIGADGSLIGYGGGIERKRWLLQHEGVLLRF
jgi:methylated-DNA-[protein]-cysteine S-methyltransferase